MGTLSERDYVAVLDRLADAVVASDMDGQIVYANPSTERLLGWPPGGLVGLHLHTLMPERMHAAHDRAFSHYRSTGVGRILGRPIRVPALHRDGREIDVELVLAGFCSATGEHLVVASLRDLRDRVELEQENRDLQAARRRLDVQHAVANALAAAERLPEVMPGVLAALCRSLEFDCAGFWTVDARHAVLRCVATWEEPWLDAREFLHVSLRTTFARGVGLPGRVWASGRAVAIRDVGTDDNVPRAAPAARAGLHGAFAFPVQAGGETLAVIDVFSREAKTLDPDLLGTVAAVGHQVGQTLRRLRAEEAMRASEVQLRLITDSLPVLISYVDTSGRYRFNNRAYEVWLGRSRDEVRGRHVREVFGEAAWEIIRPHMENALAGRTVAFDGEMTYGRAGARQVNATYVPDLAPDGSVAGLVVLVIDISERKRAEEERERLLAELRDAVAARDEFLSIASHELRTPLSVLQLQLQSAPRTLRRTGLRAGDERLLHSLDVALRQTERLARLVDELLDVSRIRIGRLALQLEDFDLAALVREVVTRHTEVATRAGCTLTLEAPHPVAGRWDRLRMEQVVTNLLSNACKYGAAKPVVVAIEAHNGRARISVSDRGIGIAPEDVGRIFGRFERAASGPHYGGLGLGLYITRQIVEAHGGSISVASRPGEGATFVIELPRTAPIEIGAPETAPP